MKKLVIAAMGIAFSVSSFAGEAAAKESDHRLSLTSDSLSSGLGVNSVEVLQRRAGPGRTAVAPLVVSALSGLAASGIGVKVSDSYQTTEEGDDLLITSEGWSVKIHGDGTQVSYRSLAFQADESAPRVKLNKRINMNRLEKLAKNALSGSLASLVVVAKGEKVVPLKSEYEIEGGATAKGETAERVVSNTIIFGRTVKGVDIVGAGSKLAFTFDNNENLVSMDIDWPVYGTSGQTQSVLPVDSIFERVSALSTMRFGADEVDVRRFECGYYDPGMRAKARSSVVQSACFVHYVGKRHVEGVAADPNNPNHGVLTSAIAEPIPAAETPLADASWPHVTALLQSGDICAVSEISTAVVQ